VADAKITEGPDVWLDFHYYPSGALGQPVHPPRDGDSGSHHGIGSNPAGGGPSTHPFSSLSLVRVGARLGAAFLSNDSGNSAGTRHACWRLDAQVLTVPWAGGEGVPATPARGGLVQASMVLFCVSSRKKRETSEIRESAIMYRAMEYPDPVELSRIAATIGARPPPSTWEIVYASEMPV